MEKELVDTFYEETSALLPILQANPELFSVLGNPQIVKEEKVALLHQVFFRKDCGGADGPLEHHC